MNIETIGVIGAGTMGSGIAQVAAQSGYEVILVDVHQDFVLTGFEKIRERLEKRVEKGKLESNEKDRILSKINTTITLEDFDNTDLIIEAVIENEGMKQQIFRDLDQICPEETIFTTNTSSISITRLASVTRRPERFVGMHFMNPAYIMKLVEIVKGLRTSDETVDMVISTAERMDKTPVIVNDFPGFVSNRVLMPMINDAISCLQDGVASRESIDSIMKQGANQPMGTIELADFIGLDVCLAILEVLHAELGENYRPCPLLRKMVSAGLLGRKSGEGFYEYGK
ncbi:MAG: 3-hydroxybutyryl-CoA dehydrogenase [Bacteroidia bacterium]|nr:MAG: 3-hydroxybutyryl-CoA dehydrogenase [Bacteroidia bacterium]